jgi:ribosomal protein S18 acetylase RimI-like enzyme
VRPADPAAVRPLDPEADRRQLASFSCRDFRYPWTDVIEDMVREHLADSVQCGETAGLVAVDGSRLCAVAGYSIATEGPRTVCYSNLLAVRMGYYRRGYGLLLEQTVIEAARQASAEAVVSDVYVDNDPMIELNIKLGANVELVPGYPDYRRCVIAL